MISARESCVNPLTSMAEARSAEARGCVWASMKPGMTVAPSRSTTFALDPAAALTSSALPSISIRPFRIHIASTADGPAMETMSPPRKTTSFDTVSGSAQRTNSNAAPTAMSKEIPMPRSAFMDARAS